MRLASTVLFLLIMSIAQGVLAPSVRAFPKSCSSDTDCDDGLYCNGQETCNVLIKKCRYGTPVNCDDGMACTIDSCDDVQARCRHTAPDNDGDGHTAISCGGDDCDDSNANRYPGNVEICDGANVDEDCDPTTFGNRDADGDGYPDAACCNEQPDHTTLCGSDCDDRRAAVHPNQAEVCNGIDDNCAAGVDEGLRHPAFPDNDGDGYGAAAASATAICPGTPGYSPVALDCDDDNNFITPGSMRCTANDEVQICGKLGLWQAPAPCPTGQRCVTQPNNTGLCLPLSQSADINGDGKIGLAEAINALQLASGL